MPKSPVRGLGIFITGMAKTEIPLKNWYPSGQHRICVDKRTRDMVREIAKHSRWRTWGEVLAYAVRVLFVMQFGEGRLRGIDRELDKRYPK